jgi:translation initiation factor 2-alpha kinase 4
MPHRKQKKNNNALQHGSPKAEIQSFPLDSSPVKGPAQGPTNYREIHQDEADALRSIYGEDFQDVEHRQGAWKVVIPSSILNKENYISKSHF